jgi:hypothetical protein
MTSLPVLHDELRPRTWGDCLRDGWGDAGTPCPWVSCAHHLAWTRAIRGDVGPGRPCEPGDERATAKLEAALSDGDSWLLDEMPATCALRVAQEPLSLDEIGAHFGFTRERARQIERIALRALDSYSNRPLLSDLLDGREVSRPDLAPQTSHFLTSADLRPALARLDPDHARLAEEASRRQGGTLRVEVRPRIAPPVRVLAGAERARRIAELKARGTAPPMDSPAGQPAATTTQETPTMTTTTKADLIEIAAAHGSKSLFAGARLAGLSASTAHSISKGLTPTERTLAKIAEALAKVRAGEKLAKPAKAAKPAKPAKAAPSSPITLDLLPRLVRVIERLGGLDRAERLAEALR